MICQSCSSYCCYERGWGSVCVCMCERERGRERRQWIKARKAALPNCAHQACSYKMQYAKAGAHSFITPPETNHLSIVLVKELQQCKLPVAENTADLFQINTVEQCKSFYSHQVLLFHTVPTNFNGLICFPPNTVDHVFPKCGIRTSGKKLGYCSEWRQSP